MMESISKTKYGDLQDVIFTSLEPICGVLIKFVHQWQDLFAMFTMERSAVPPSVQVLICFHRPLCSDVISTFSYFTILQVHGWFLNVEVKVHHSCGGMTLVLLALDLEESKQS